MYRQIQVSLGFCSERDYHNEVLRKSSTKACAGSKQVPATFRKEGKTLQIPDLITLQCKCVNVRCWPEKWSVINKNIKLSINESIDFKNLT